MATYLFLFSDSTADVGRHHGLALAVPLELGDLLCGDHGGGGYSGCGDGSLHGRGRRAQDF